MRSVFFILSLIILVACSRKAPSHELPTPKVSNIQLGDSLIYLVKGEGIANQIILVNVHENEQTAIKTMIYGSYKFKFPYVFIHQNKQRRIAFSVNDTVYSVDPNRIFTDTGCVRTLKDSMNYSDAGLLQTKKLADLLVEELTGKEWLITLHNNTDSNYSILSYADNGEEAKNTGELFVNTTEDPDDFIYTTDQSLFEYFKAKKVNAILQDNDSFLDDGSLSVYCGINGVKYVNIETEHGHLSKQIELFDLLVEFLGY